MNLNREQIKYYVYKKLLPKKLTEDIIADCEKHGVSVRNYLLAKEITTEASELPALGDYLNLPSVELDMLDIDKELFDKVSFAFMKKHKIIPVRYDKNGTLLVATGKPLDARALSALATHFNCKYDFVLVPPTQIDRYVDSVSASITTSLVLSDLNAERTDQQIEQLIAGNEQQAVSKEDDVINNPAVRLVDSIVKVL